MPKIRRNLLIVVFALLVCAVCVPAALARSHSHHRRSHACRVARRHHHPHSSACRRHRRHHRKHFTHDRRRSTSTSTSTSTTPNSIYWGANVGSQFTGQEAPWDWKAQLDFQKSDAGGKGASIAAMGSPFYSSAWCSGYCYFPTTLFQSIRTGNEIPWISWQTTSSTGTGGYTDAQIASGAQDGYIKRFAQQAKAWGHPFFLRFDWEMNGNWWNWSPGQDGNTAADYVAMWRHVHDIFNSVGATNASWVWCPNIDSKLSSQANLYPGDAYVDWTCLDGYNGNDPWTSFKDLFKSSYDAVSAIAPSKPVMIGETSSTEAGGSKAKWIEAMFDSLPTDFPNVHGLLWYDVATNGPGGHTDWPIESSDSAVSAFSSGINSSAFTSSTYGSLDTSPIPAP